MEEKNNCNCGNGQKMVLACSGAADVGLLSDKVARMLNLKGERKLSCMALLGAEIEGPVNEMREKNILVIDGCSVDCGKKMVEKSNLTNYTHLRLTDHGFIKGETMVDNVAISNAYNIALAVV